MISPSEHRAAVQQFAVFVQAQHVDGFLIGSFERFREYPGGGIIVGDGGCPGKRGPQIGAFAREMYEHGGVFAQKSGRKQRSHAGGKYVFQRAEPRDKRFCQRQHVAARERVGEQQLEHTRFAQRGRSAENVFIAQALAVAFVVFFFQTRFPPERCFYDLAY
ncbi:MAG: hypothetical protein IJL41_04055 [Clostridia bacterium]|nr:hypothetical protein [Clostridia bacterium]